MRTLALIAWTAFTGCGWNHLPNGDYLWLDTPLWDPVRVVPTTDGLYVQQPDAGDLLLVRPDGASETVDLASGRVTEASVAPDDTTVIAFVTREQCLADEDPA